MSLIPIVIDKNGREERAMDIYSRLLQDRVIFLGTQVTDESANSIVAQLLYLQSVDPKADVHLYINSPGGSVTAGLAIYDTMQYISCDVATYCIGQCASMGAVLLTAGAPGKRFALPNSRVMIHQPLAGMEGTAEEIMIHAKEFRFIKSKINDILIKHTGRTLEEIQRDLREQGIGQNVLVLLLPRGDLLLVLRKLRRDQVCRTAGDRLLALQDHLLDLRVDRTHGLAELTMHQLVGLLRDHSVACLHQDVHDSLGTDDL